jgi:hypothetical protein
MQSIKWVDRYKLQHADVSKKKNSRFMPTKLMPLCHEERRNPPIEEGRQVALL